MELNLSEINKINPYETFDYKSYEQNEHNYWEKPKVEEKQTKKKKISFNDILSNMNLVVNNKGVLQFMIPNHNEQIQQNYDYNPNEFYQPQYQNDSLQKQDHSLQENKNLQPIDNAVKHSYIFNKYFKDYKDPNADRPDPRVPKTIEEYHQMLLEDRIKAIEHKKMVEQVKSKKMLFTAAPGATSNPRNLQASRNNLRMMNFR